MEHEEWRWIVRFEGMYEVSNVGRVRSHVRYRIPRILKYYTNPKGYQQITFTVQGVSRTFWLHRIVALAYVRNPESHNEVNHLDGIKSHNSATNLEWVAHRDNILHAYRTGLRKPNDLKGEQINASHLKEADVLEIRRLYVPHIVSQATLARQFGVTKPTIRHIVNRKTWRHI